ncbi:Serine/arginine repetitive matrix protein 2 [Toensbergia leucococca]|nr:Serine/arginine repetitive matrix protein 2 [Toensbergia leucococca]
MEVPDGSSDVLDNPPPRPTQSGKAPDNRRRSRRANAGSKTLTKPQYTGRAPAPEQKSPRSRKNPRSRRSRTQAPPDSNSPSKSLDIESSQDIATSQDVRSSLPAQLTKRSNTSLRRRTNLSADESAVFDSESPALHTEHTKSGMVASDGADEALDTSNCAPIPAEALVESAIPGTSPTKKGCVGPSKPTYQSPYSNTTETYPHNPHGSSASCDRSELSDGKRHRSQSTPKDKAAPSLNRGRRGRNQSLRSSSGQQSNEGRTLRSSSRRSSSQLPLESSESVLEPAIQSEFDESAAIPELQKDQSSTGRSSSDAILEDTEAGDLESHAAIEKSSTESDVGQAWPLHPTASHLATRPDVFSRLLFLKHVLLPLQRL